MSGRDVDEQIPDLTEGYRLKMIDDQQTHSLPADPQALEAVRQGDWGRVVAVFQPHRYSRTAAHWQEFAHVFDRADVVVVDALYPAGEAPVPGVSSELVASASDTLISLPGPQPEPLFEPPFEPTKHATG